MDSVLLSSLALVSTTAGGLCALRLQDRLHLMLGFTAGALLGVVAFDLLPEIFALSRELGPDGCRPAMLALAAGFMVFHGLEKFVLVHRAHEAGHVPRHRRRAGVLSAAALVGHSLMDGLGIGLAFQVSPGIGAAVALAVIAHDFCDGLNTVGLMRLHGNTTRHALGMLALDAVAPVLGAAAGLAFSVPAPALVLYLGFFAGFLLCIAATDILPEAHARAGPAAAGSLMGATLLGAAFIFLVTGAVA